MTVRLSIVVIGRNEGQRLNRCLQSIHSVQGLAKAPEIIYVDSGSIDGSPDLAASLGAHVIVLNSAYPTAALGRNAGWRHATGEFILFLDGDTILHPDFPKRALEAISADPSIAAVWGHRREIHPSASLYNRILDLDWIYAPGKTDFCGGDVLMRRDVLETAGGYDPTLIAGEEPELCRRIRAAGRQILHIDAPMTGHDLAMTRFRQYWKRAVRCGHAYAEVSSRFRNSSDPFWQKERMRNLVQGGFWASSIIAAIALSLALESILPLILWGSLLALLSFRSAWQSRWKCQNPTTLMLYGFHSHFQQIPISLGQLQHEFSQRLGTRRALIEYKDNV